MGGGKGHLNTHATAPATGLNIDKTRFKTRPVNRRRTGRRDLEEKISELEKKLAMLSSAVVPTELDLELEVHDFGPIQDAHIRFRPLTVFIGPNNSGKSYAALLAHSAISLISRPRAVMNVFKRTSGMGAIHGYANKYRPTLKLGVKKNEFLVTRRNLGALSRDAATVIAVALSEEIEKNFGADPCSLVRSGRSHASIKIPGVLEISIPRNRRKRAAPLDQSTNSTMSRKALMDKANDGMKVRNGDGTVLACTFASEAGTAVDAESAYNKILSRIIVSVFNNHGYAVPTSTSYLPATRSGIMEAYKAILSFVTRSYADQRDVSRTSPHMKAVDYEFVATMLEMGNKKGGFSKIANELENAALHGKINIQYEANGFTPDIYYARQREMPIHQASSAVSELAPLVLFLRHIVKKGDLLIIEEPESHMHPKNQVELAKCIVRLVRAGLNVVVTTHSTYMVERLSAYLRAGQMTAAQRSMVGIERGLYLKEDDIAPYLFDTKGNKTVVTSIDYSAREGISQEEFMELNEKLHEENIRADKFVE